MYMSFNVIMFLKGKWEGSLSGSNVKPDKRNSKQDS